MNTKGWDIVSFTSIVHLNSAIHDSWKEENVFFDIVYSDYSLHGKFGIWNVADGGGGRYIRMELPVTKAVFSVEGREDMDLSGMVIAADVMLNFFESADSEKNAGRSELKFDFKRVVSPTKQAETHTFCNEEGTSMKLQVKLDYFPQPKPVADNGDYELKVKTDSASQEDPIVAIVSFTPTSKLPFIIKAVLQEILLNWFNLPENLARFNTLFSTVTINNIGKNEDFEWLQPTYMSYA